MWFPEMLYTMDVLFIVFVLIFAVGGTKRGLSGELAHVVTLLALLACFCFFYPQIMQMVANAWHTLPEPVLQIIVPLALVLAALLFFVLARALLKHLLKSKVDGTFDKIAGGLTGALRGALLGLAVLAGLSLIPSDALYRVLSEKSSIGGWACNTLTPWAQSHMVDLPVLKNKMGKQLDDAGEQLDDMSDQLEDQLDDLTQ